jgi:hypothetical protein
MQDQKKYLKAALEKIKGVARATSAARLKHKMAAKSAPKAEAPKAKESAAEELKEALKSEPEPEADEPEVDDLKKTAFVSIPSRRKAPPPPAPKAEAPPAKRKPGRPRKAPVE